jgi:hypothetical protein
MDCGFAVAMQLPPETQSVQALQISAIEARAI